MLRPLSLILLLVCFASHVPFARAEVVRVQVDRREPFAPGVKFGDVGEYERLIGRLFLEVDPQADANSAVVDVKLAPRNAAGRVEFWTDFCLLKPVDLKHGNRRLLYDVNNRGNKLALGTFNNQGGNDPRNASDAGNGFLMQQGYCVLWCGWNGDVLPGDNRLLIELPPALENDQPLVGRVHAEVTVNSASFSQPLYWGNSNSYPAADRNGLDAVLTMRAKRSDPPIQVPRDGWSFARVEAGQPVADSQHLYVKEGFRPGWLYDLVYTARGSRVTGLGLAAVRDVVSYFRYSSNEPSTPNPMAGAIDKTIIFGVSQSGRFIHHFVWQGFNADPQGRIVFDGALPLVAGGGKGYFNYRFAQTTRHGSQHEDNLSPSELFPFTTTRQV
ncbi:MAG: alpha/beta hydrolase domain-containing protein, partial [Planctomycetota bacterium]|nr:alpha/beta hydrolase domain-containing protein [Planctomycetota bacterium]